jgi:predicted DNA-binding protein (MmcQ/YjbR family)
VHAALIAHALTFPEATLEHPWGEDAVKVRGKVFAFLGSGNDDSSYVMSVKLPESGPMALMLECAEPTGYGLGKSGWVSFRGDSNDLPPVEVLEDWIEESYRTVAPRSLVARLDAAGT